jgi:peptidoglycan/LPS O-acetylase OafA/YrhL
MGNNAEIERLRALAILVTVYAHFGFVTLGQSDVYIVLQHYIGTSNGVILFFVISGFVISKTLIPEIDSGRPVPHVLTAFWIRRATRILPLCTLWLAIPLALSFFFNSRGLLASFEANLDGSKAAALFYYNIFLNVYRGHHDIFAVYWSLSLEEQFYALYPFLLLFFGPMPFRLLGIALVCLAIAATPLYSSVFQSGSLRIDPMLYGCVVYLIASNYRRRYWCVPAWLGLPLSLTLVLSLVTIHYTLGPLLPSLLALPSMALNCALLVWLAAQERNFIPSLGRFIDPVMSWIGSRSFGIYLIHLPVFAFAGEWTWRFQRWDTVFGRTVVAFAVIAISVEASYRFVEVPIRRWGRQLSSRVGTEQAQVYAA